MGIRSISICRSLYQRDHDLIVVSFGILCDLDCQSINKERESNLLISVVTQAFTGNLVKAKIEKSNSLNFTLKKSDETDHVIMTSS